MKLSYIKYLLELKHRFTISHSSRTGTPAVLIKIEQDGISGFGEASLPPYLAETQDSVINFIRKINLRNIYSLEDLLIFFDEIKIMPTGDYAAKAAFNIALFDLLGKINNKPVSQYFNLNDSKKIFYTSYTIGIDEEKKLREKISGAADFKFLKIKLGTTNDKDIIKIIRQETDKPLFVDANQGWKDKHYAADMINFLKDENVLLVEQPMPVNLIEDYAWLKENSLLPIFADESVQTLGDIITVKDSFHGINIKLMKCGGISEAFKMIKAAQEYGLKIMLGCMTETSCAIAAASQLSPMADFLDLDGNILINNDPFVNTASANGKIILSESPGLGIYERIKLF